MNFKGFRLFIFLIELWTYFLNLLILKSLNFLINYLFIDKKSVSKKNEKIIIYLIFSVRTLLQLDSYL